MSFKTVIATGFHEAYFNALNTLARMPVQEGGPLDLSEFNRGMSELKGALLLNLTDIRGSKNALDLLFSPVKTEESAHNLFTNIVRFIPAAGETPRNAADRIDANPVYYNFLLAKALINSSEETQLHKSDELAPVRSFVLGALYALGDSLKQTQPEDTAEKIESILWNARYPAFGDDDEVFLATKAYFDSMTCYATSQFAPQCTVSENGLEGLKTFFSSRVRNVPSRTFARVSLPVKATDSAEPVTTVVELKGRSSDGSFNDEGFLMQKGEKGDPSKTKYKRSRVLGEGATGQVIEAFDTENHRDVAIKISLYSSIDTKLPPGSFDFERRIAASFSGEIVPEILDNGETPEGYPFTVMKILIGESLDKKILKGKLSIEGAYEVIGEVISLFSKVHARGVAHRDIKPENIFLTNHDGVKIIDFGLAYDTNHFLGLIYGPNKIYGTPQYMAPECWNGAQDHDLFKQDVYALGIVMYECLVGKLPYQPKSQNPDPHEWLSALQEKQRDPELLRPSLHNESVSNAVDEVILKALSKDPENRYRDARELLTAWHKAMSQDFHAREPQVSGVFQRMKLWGSQVINQLFRLFRSAKP